jgi:hypothetical protein
MSEVSRAQLKKYRDVISLWLSKYDTAEIAGELDRCRSMAGGAAGSPISAT